MKLHFRIRLILTVLLVMLSLATPTSAQDGPAPVGARPDAPAPYALHGPYWVGAQTLEMNAGTPEALHFTVWYPALNPDGLEESIEYELTEGHLLHELIPADAQVSYTIRGHALKDAAPDLSGGPYPLVINSHGFTAQMWQVYLGEHLASYGFVVIAPDHTNDSWDNVYADVVTRMFEVKHAINYAEQMTASDGLLAGMIDMEHIAVGGHSAGGMTSFGAGGAPVSLDHLKAFCGQFPDATECSEIDKQIEDIIAMVGQEPTADGQLPAVWDDRIDAIFPMAGSTELHGAAELQAITVPMMVLYGSNDPTFPLDEAYGGVSSQEKAWVLFENGGHDLFYNHCDAFSYIVDYDLYWACSDAVWDLYRAQDLINYFVTAFLLDTLKGDTDAHAALAPDAVSFPGIVYTAEGF